MVRKRSSEAANGEKFARLWRGDTSGYPSQSEADMALCCLLAFWTGGDPQRVDRLFRQSGLMRDKWDEVHYADGRTYGEVTVQRALRVTDETYKPRADTAATGPAADAAASDTPPEATVTTPGGDSTDQSQSLAYLRERNRLLKRRVREQAGRIAALEAQLTQTRSADDCG